MKARCEICEIIEANISKKDAEEDGWTDLTVSTDKDIDYEGLCPECSDPFDKLVDMEW